MWWCCVKLYLCVLLILIMVDCLQGIMKMGILVVWRWWFMLTCYYGPWIIHHPQRCMWYWPYKMVHSRMWYISLNLLVIGNCLGHLLFFVWPNLSYVHSWYVRKLNAMKVENLMVICGEPMITSSLDSKLVLKRKKDTLDQVIIHRLCLNCFWHEAQGQFNMFKEDRVCASNSFVDAMNLHIFHIRSSLWIVIGNEDECIWMGLQEPLRGVHHYWNSRVSDIDI